MNFLNKNVCIHGVGGYVCVAETIDRKIDNNEHVKNTQQQLDIVTQQFMRYGWGCGNLRRTFYERSGFHVVPLEEDTSQNIYNMNGRKVAFRVYKQGESSSDPAKYLTLPLYGDGRRNEVATVLAEHATDLLPELIPIIVDYVAAGETDQTNFEGAGFNYTPMCAAIGERKGKPGPSQIFSLEPQGGTRRFGIKSICGKYWRSQHWKSTVSQSDHCRGDETWSISLHPSSEEGRMTEDKEWEDSSIDDSSDDYSDLEHSDDDESMARSDG